MEKGGPQCVVPTIGRRRRPRSGDRPTGRGRRVLGSGLRLPRERNDRTLLAGAASWRRLDDGPPFFPARRTAPVPLVDPLKRELIVEGGYDPVTFGFYDTYAHILSPADLWTWPLDSASPTWTTVRTRRRCLFLDLGRAVLDPVRRLQIRFFQDPPTSPSVRALGCCRWTSSGVWAPLVVSGSGPDPAPGVPDRVRPGSRSHPAHRWLHARPAWLQPFLPSRHLVAVARGHPGVDEVARTTIPAGSW